MKVYRCILGCLMAIFIIFGVWYIVSCFDEQRSTKDGTLILEELDRGLVEDAMRGAEKDVSDNSIY